MGILVFGLNYGPYLLSMRFIDVSAASVLAEVWPAFFILVMGRLFGSGSSRLGWALWPVLAVAFFGVALVVASQEGRILTGEGGWRLWLGVALALGSGLLAVLSALIFVWAHRFAAALGRPGSLSDVFMGVLVVSCVGNTLSGLVLAFGALPWERSGSVEAWPLAWLVMGSAFLAFPGMALFRLRNVIATDFSMNVLSFLVPLLGLLVLLAFGRVGVARVDLLFAGAALVVAANVVVNLGPEAADRLRRR